MPDTASITMGGAVLEVVSPDGARRYVRVTQTPFLLGRGAETGNHLQLSDRRISRNCAALVLEGGRLYIEDRGQRRGLFVNGEKVESRALSDGDSITFGLEDSYEVVFRSGSSSGEESIPNLLTRIEHITSSEPVGGGLRKLHSIPSSALCSIMPSQSLTQTGACFLKLIPPALSKSGWPAAQAVSAFRRRALVQAKPRFSSHSGSDRLWLQKTSSAPIWICSRLKASLRNGCAPSSLFLCLRCTGRVRLIPAPRLRSNILSAYFI